MGCCASTPRSSPPYPSSSARPAASPPSSSTNITTAPANFSTTSLPLRSEPDNAASTTTMSYRNSPALPRTAHPNTPLKAIPVSRRSHTPGRRPWTEERLRRERVAFWETRTSGRQEIWGGLRLVVELLQSALLTSVQEGGAEGEEAEGVREAQGVLDASGVTCPAGWVWKGCFDERGGFYGVPEWVVVRPEEIFEGVDEEGEMGLLTSEGKAGVRHVETQEEVRTSEYDTDKATEAFASQTGLTAPKEKEKEKEEDAVQIRFRLSTGAQDITLSLPRSYKVLQIREALLAHILSTPSLSSSIPPDSTLRLIYLGQPLPSTHPLTEAWNPAHPISVFVVPKPEGLT